MKSLLFAGLTLLCLPLIAQEESCSHKVFNELEAADFEEAINIPSMGLSTTSCNTIRVVVHVIYDGNESSPSSSGYISEAQIKSQIRITNQFFRNDSLMYHEDNTPLGYKLSLATEDPSGNPTSGIIYHDGVELFGSTWSTYGLQNSNNNAIPEGDLADEVAWGTDINGKKYLNSYVVSKIDGNSGSGTQAYAYFPTNNNVYGNYNLFNAFGSEQLEAEYGEDFTLKSYTDIGLTWTHEVLHNFAIFHTFNGNSCNDEFNPNIQGDRVVDTPPQTQGYGCSGSCGFLSNNVMDYLSQNCKTKITPGQVERAGLAINNSLQDYLTCEESDLCEKNPDFNADGTVNIIDISILGPYFGCSSEQDCYEEAFDMNCDNMINIVDVSLMMTEF